MSDELSSQSISPTYVLPPRRNIFSDMKDSSEGLKYRLDSKDILTELKNRLLGAVYDDRGRILRYDTQYALVNTFGYQNIEAYVSSHISKITKLTKYENEDRILRQVRYFLRTFVKLLVKNKREWGIRDKDLVLAIVENFMVEAKFVAHEGFENNNISKSWMVQENIDLAAQQQQSGFLSRLNPFRR